MSKKVIALLLTTCMGITMLSACGNNQANKVKEESAEEQQTESNIEEKEEKEEPEEPEEPVEITWLGYYTSNITISEDTWAEKLLEEATNVEINVVTNVNKENIDTFIASGEILDVTCISSHLYSDTAELYSQGLIREIPEEWLWEYYPTGMKIVEEVLGKEYVAEGGHLFDGKCLFTPYVGQHNDSIGTLMYRNDWMKNLGMSEPRTLDELHDLLYAFTYNDPDGNGKDDTYGICPAFGWFGMWPVYGAFGFANDFSNGNFVLADDGSVSYTTASEAYRDALTVIKEWYDEGIIDPECLTTDRGGVRTKWTEGKSGMMVDSTSWLLSSRGVSGVVGMLEEVAGEGIVSVMNPLSTEYGDGNVYAPIVAGITAKNVNMSLHFSAKATDEQVIAVLKVLEEMTSNQELYIKILYGEEGVDYTIADTGALKVADTITVEYQAEKGIDTYFGNPIRPAEVAMATYSDRDNEMFDIMSKWSQCPMNSVLSNYLNESYDTYYSEVKKVEQEYYANVLLGNANLEKDWDTYLNNMNKAGLDKIIAEYEEAVK